MPANSWMLVTFKFDYNVFARVLSQEKQKAMAFCNGGLHSARQYHQRVLHRVSASQAEIHSIMDTSTGFRQQLIQKG